VEAPGLDHEGAVGRTVLVDRQLAAELVKESVHREQAEKGPGAEVDLAGAVIDVPDASRQAVDDQ
jgi:hypothetical protein